MLCAVVEKVHGCHDATVLLASCVRVIEPNELAGLLVRQRLEQHRVDGAEHGRRSADADGERQDGDRREAGIARERAQREAEVAPAVVEESRAARVADVVLHPLDAAERQCAPPASLARALSATLELLRFHVAWKSQLLGELALVAAPEDDRAYALDDVREHARMLMRFLLHR